MKGNFPFKYSFQDARKPEGISDFIIRLSHTGVYWILKTPEARSIIGNYFSANPKYTTDSSLLQLSGDVQTLAFSPDPTKPSKYLDRRSPTVVFGKAGRSFVQVGTVTQNCVHPSGSPCATNVQNGMHKLPYVNPPTHPKTTFLPYFNISAEGTIGSNPVFDFDDAGWGGYRVVDDDTWKKDADFAKVKYDVNADIFNLGGTNQLKNYKFFMTQVINEVYNKSYNWIVANSKPLGGSVEPGEKYTLRQSDIKVLSGYPNAQIDKIFFYGTEKEQGNVFAADRLKISQYRDDGGSIRVAGDIFDDGIFRGNLNAIRLYSENFQNPYKIDGTSDLKDYDIRQKSNYIFNSFAEFEKLMTVVEGDSLVLKEGGVIFIDSREPCNFKGSLSSKKFVFHENAMIICSGDIRLPEVTKSRFAVNDNSTLSLVSIAGDIYIAGKNIEASLNALSGTIKKEVDYFQIFGNMTMGRIFFDLNNKGSLFKVSSFPSNPSEPVLGKNEAKGFERISAMYDPGLDVCSHATYKNHYNVFVSARPIYWKLSGED